MKILLLAAGWAVLGGAALGQTHTLPPASALKTLSLDQLLNIEVTSVSKRPEKLVETASAIQVVTGEDIRSAGATSLPEALRLATNLEVAQVDSRQWAITARGFNNTTANKMLVLMDGRMVYTPLYAGVFWEAQDTLLEDIDRIEVISGPGATQWGANAVNGVINIITKSARETQGGILLGGGGNEYGAFGGVRYGGEAAPGVFYRVYAKYSDRDQSVLPNGRGAPDDWHSGQVGFRVDWEPIAGSALTLQGDAYRGRAKQALQLDVEMSGGNLLGRWTRRFAESSEVKLQAYFDRTHRKLPGSANADVDIADLDFQHQFAAGGSHHVVWGLGYRRIEDKIANIGTLFFFPQRTKRDWFSGFVQDEFPLVRDVLQLTLGTKLEHNDYTGVEVQPSARFAWKLARQQTVWGAISRAIRAPSRIDRELYTPGTPPFLLAGGPNFKSERLVAYELGYRAQPNPRTALSVAAFYHDYDGLRSLEPVSPPAPFPVVVANGLRGHSTGAEFTADYHVSDTWRLQAGWTEMRVHSQAKPGSLDRTSVRSQSLDPNHQVRLRSVLMLPHDIEFDVTARYTSEINNQEVPAYREVDARLGWRPSPGWELSLVGQNLLHGHHPEFGTPGARREIERGVYGKVVWHF